MTPDGPTEDLADLYENAPCGYLSMRRDGRIVNINATLLGWLGLSRDEALGKRLYDLLTVPGRIFYETHFASLLRMQGFFNEVALDLTTMSGQVVPVLANAAEKKDADGNLLFTRVTFFQAGDRRRYERELVRAKAIAEKAQTELADLVASLEGRIEDAVRKRLKAEQGLATERQTAQLREQFIAVLGHDLRNPLASILSGLQILLREPQSERAKSLITLMEESAGRMSGLINDLLDLARVRLGGGFEIAAEETDVAALLKQAVGEIAASFPERSLVEQYDLPQPVMCDPMRIGQLASNLVGNAIVHGAADRPIRICAEMRDGFLSIAVSNEGTPIGPETRKQLFHPFFRGKVQKGKEGLGLGLYICSEIARAHGGTLDVESGDKETAFIFRIPAPVASQDQPAP